MANTLGKIASTIGGAVVSIASFLGSANAGPVMEISPMDPNKVVLNQPNKGYVSLYTDDSSSTKVRSLDYNIYCYTSNYNVNNASLPSTNDFFGGFGMDSSYNQVDSTVSASGWLDNYNRRRVLAIDGPQVNTSTPSNKKFVETFTFTPITSANTKFALSGASFHDSNNNVYTFNSSNLNNVSFAAKNAAQIALENIVNGTIVSGGTASLGIEVRNSAPVAPAVTLDYTLNLAGLNVNIGSWNQPSGSLVIGSSENRTIPVSSTNIGINNLVLSAREVNPNLVSPANASTSATLTVLDHSNASFSGSEDLDHLVLDFGSVKKGETATRQFSLANLSRADGLRVGLDLDNISTLSSEFTTNLSSIDNLSQGNSNSYHFNLDSSGLGLGDFDKYVTLRFSDDDALSGAAGVQELTVELKGDVQPVPEPATVGFLALGGAALGGAALAKRRREDDLETEVDKK